MANPSTRYHERKTAGFCVRCGKVPPEHGLVSCGFCNARFNAITWLSRQKQVAKGLCAVCTSERTNHRWFCDVHLAYNKVKQAKCNDKLKIETLSAYGDLKCACPGCEEALIKFLTLDHVNNDGYKDRHRLGIGVYASYGRLKRLGFPNDPPLQVLCYNCNNGKRVNGGICPHIVQQVPATSSTSTKNRVL